MVKPEMVWARPPVLNRPLLAVAGGEYLRVPPLMRGGVDLGFTYVSNQRVIIPGSARQDAAIVLHQQASDEIDHPGYRAACYQRPNVSDRLSLLLQPAGDIWLSVNFYRDSAQGKFAAGEIAAIETLAPLFAHGVQHHYRLNGQPQQGAGPMMLASLRRHCPELSKRELDVLRGVLEGATAVEIADAMGLQPSSVITYQKRAYKRMGISSQRQLFALCMGPQAI